MFDDFDAGEPPAEDLDAIEAEWPLIEAELELLDAEIRLLLAEHHPSELDWRRLRRAERNVLRAAVQVAAVTLPADRPTRHLRAA